MDAAAAFAMRDANADNFRVFNHFFDTTRRSRRRGAAILERYQGIPWVNTIVADKKGDALYADIGAIPNVTDAKAQDCNSRSAGRRSSCSACRSSTARGRRATGASTPTPPSPACSGRRMPRLMRNDYVTNSNDSYWLSNPKQPLEGFARIIGDERTARTLRTRIGLIMTQARIDGTDGLGPPASPGRTCSGMVFSDRQYGGELDARRRRAMCRCSRRHGAVVDGPVAGRQRL